MILTGTEIINRVAKGEICISPFDVKHVNPNSYNYHLWPILKAFNLATSIFEQIEIPSDGIVLEPGQMYLGTTCEKLWSSKCAMSLIWRSSLGRLGLFLQVSANLWHTGSHHCWTLEIVACKKIRIYPYMKIGQISFWENFWEIGELNSIYSQYSHPQESFNKH